MKIAIFISKFYPEFSGVGHRVAELYSELNKRRKISVDVYCGGKEIKPQYNYHYRFFKIKRFKETSQNTLKILKIISSIFTFFKIFNILKKNKYDCVHIIGSNDITCAAINSASLLEIPRIIELVTKKSSPYQLLPIIKYVYRPSFFFNSLIISINKQIITNFKNKKLKNKLWIRDNPINKNFIFPNKYKLKREKLGFKRNDIIISQIAQFYESKNQIFLIDVLSHLSRKFKLILAGPLTKKGDNTKKDLEYFKKIKKKINIYGLQKQVKLIPKFIHSAEILNISNISAMPNYNEGFGNPLIESLGLGIPVVANYDEKIFRKWIIKSYNGDLIKLNAKEWAKKIESFNMNYSRTNISKDIHKKINYETYITTYAKIFDYFSKINKKDNINIKRIINK